jgi:hypothetical protein
MSIFAKKQTAPETTSNRGDFAVDVDTSGVPSQPLPRTPSNAAAAPAYGIADAMQLMRSLPSEGNMDLVVRVVRVTLGSVNVKLEDIIEDASRRQKAIQDRISALHGQVSELEEQLEARRREIGVYEADMKETTAVKERLALADKVGGHAPGAATQPPPPPPPSSRMATLPRASERE